MAIIGEYFEIFSLLQRRRFIIDSRSIKVHEIGSLPEILAVVTIDDDNGIEKLAWSEDGQLLAAATTYGSIVIYLSKLPMLASAYLNYICVLTSLSQITIYLHSLEKVRGDVGEDMFMGF